MSYIYVLRDATNAIFIINFVLNLLEAWLLLYTKKYSRSETQKQKNKKVFIFLACTQWVLISGLRSEYIGNDTMNYLANFELHHDMPWSKVFECFPRYYIDNDPNVYFEPGYILFERIVGIFTDSPVAYNFVIASIFMTAFGNFVYDNSEDPSLSFLLYSGIFYGMFSLTGYRQVLSVSIGIFWSFKYLKQRRFLPFATLVFLSSLLHKSTLVFLPFYFISQIKISKKYVAFVAVTAAIMIALRGPLFNFVKTVVGYEQYEGMSLNQNNFIILLMVFIVVSAWRYKPIIERHPNAKVYYNGLIMSVLMLPFAMVSPTSMRLVYDFAFQMMFLLPLVVETFEGKKDKMVVYAVVVSIFAYFIVQKTPYYLFFWEL